MYDIVFREELRGICLKNAVKSVLGVTLIICGPIAVFISVTVMATSFHLLTPVNVFMVMAFINVLRLNIGFDIGMGLQVVADACVSLVRIQEFLLLATWPGLSEKRYEQDVCSDQTCGSVSARESAGESLESSNGYIDSVTHQKDSTHQNSTHLKHNIGLDSAQNSTCIVSNLTICSDRNNGKYILRSVNFEAAEGSLVVVSGPVGSGKSSLLSAINQEVISEGSIYCRGTIAYVPQTPWVFRGTIRENILFGEEFNEERYKTVVKKCALELDINKFPDDDQTLVGENGVVLSGGQQARISLARAVYANSDVYLLDDPLSAVDANVGEHIFQECICKLLSTKTRIFVTHQVSHMKMADQIVLLSNGDVIGKGTFTEIMQSGVLSTVHDIVSKKTKSHTQDEGALKEQDQETEDWTEGMKSTSVEDVARGLEIPEEDRITGTISWKQYWKYFMAGNSSVVMVGLFVVLIFGEGEPIFLVKLHLSNNVASCEVYMIKII